MGAPAHDPRADAIEAHLPLVRSIARRYAGRGEPLEDLVQAGTVGLIKAVDRYDPSRHRDLVALARPSIEGEIRHHLRDRGSGAHVPRPDRELAARTRAAATDLTARLHREPTLAELAVATGADEARVAQALQAGEATRAVAVDPRSAGGGGDDDAEAAEARVLLAAGWGALDERERRMLELRYREDRSQSEIAREMGLSQAHVSRLLRGALARLRAEVDPAAAADGAGAPPPGPPARSGRVLLRLPRTLHGELAAAAEREGVSLNGYITGRLAAAVAAPEAEPPAASARHRRLLVVNALVIALAAVAGLVLVLLAVLG